PEAIMATKAKGTKPLFHLWKQNFKGNEMRNRKESSKHAQDQKSEVSGRWLQGAGLRSDPMKSAERLRFKLSPYGFHACNPRSICRKAVGTAGELFKKARARLGRVQIYRVRLLHHRGRQAPLDQSFGNRVPRQSGDVMNIEFIHHLLPVFFHGLDA